MTLSDTDHAMIQHAKRRGLVLVDRFGRDVEAVLIAWKPTRRDKKHRNVARVQFVRTDTQGTVPTSEVRLP